MNPGSTHTFPEDLRRFVAGERWTLRENNGRLADEYLVRARVDPDLFERTVTHIRSNGYVGFFYRVKEITY